MTERAVLHGLLAVVLDSDRAFLASHTADEGATRILYRLQVEGGLELVTGDPAYTNALALTRETVGVDITPNDCARVAASLLGLLNREPMKSSGGYAFERLVLGALLVDLESIARAAGEPVGAQRDLRNATTKRDQIEAQQRAEQAERAYSQAVTDAIEGDARMAALEDVPDEPEHVRAALSETPRNNVRNNDAPAMPAWV